jgi:hypothetical protein
MKWLNHLLALYLVLLSVVPCCAFDNCPEEKSTTSQSTSHENGDDDDCGSCSPFFNCEGCASVTIDVQSLSFDIVLASGEKTYTDFILSSLAAVHYDFWQPPRLV